MKNNISFWSSLISCHLMMKRSETAGHSPTSLGRLPLVVSQPAPAILWLGPSGRSPRNTATMRDSSKATASSTITTLSQKHLECPHYKLRENRVQCLIHPCIPHHAWSSGSARRKTLGNYPSNKGFTDLCLLQCPCNFCTLKRYLFLQRKSARHIPAKSNTLIIEFLSSHRSILQFSKLLGTF